MGIFDKLFKRGNTTQIYQCPYKKYPAFLTLQIQKGMKELQTHITDGKWKDKIDRSNTYETLYAQGVKFIEAGQFQKAIEKFQLSWETCNWIKNVGVLTEIGNAYRSLYEQSKNEELYKKSEEYYLLVLCRSYISQDADNKSDPLFSDQNSYEYTRQVAYNIAEALNGIGGLQNVRVKEYSMRHDTQQTKEYLYRAIESFNIALEYRDDDFFRKNLNWHVDFLKQLNRRNARRDILIAIKKGLLPVILYPSYYPTPVLGLFESKNMSIVYSFDVDACNARMYRNGKDDRDGYAQLLPFFSNPDDEKFENMVIDEGENPAIYTVSEKDKTLLLCNKTLNDFFNESIIQMSK